jgi:glutamate carboxypeptidase
VAAVEAFFKALPEHTHVPGVTVSAKGSVSRPPMEPDERTLQLWQFFQSEAAKMGLKIDYIATGGCSDGNFAAALDVPTIDGMGLVGGNAHREDEYVELGSIVPQILLIVSVCKALCNEILCQRITLRV